MFDAVLQFLNVLASVMTIRRSGESRNPFQARQKWIPACAGMTLDEKKPAYLPAFFSFLAARFSFSVLAGSFLVSFLRSMPLLITVPSVDGAPIMRRVVATASPGRRRRYNAACP
jgi:hypothetical protein